MIGCLKCLILLKEFREVNLILYKSQSNYCYICIDKHCNKVCLCKINNMLVAIEKELSKFESHIIDYSSIKSILLNMGYTRINNKIIQLRQKGVIKSIKKGLYFHKSLIQENYLSKEILANTILGPSYISLEYALSFYNLIPEAVYEMTSVCTKRSKKFNTEVGIFNYKHIKKELFSIGINIESATKGNFLIATKEKALCDIIYFTKGIALRSEESMIQFLENDLRIDMQELKEIDIDIVEQYYKVSKSSKIEIFIKIIQKHI